MTLIYLLGVKTYGAIVYLLSFNNPKAKQWIDGRKNIWDKLNEKLSDRTEKRIWFHCSSLGEFEQGKPIIEAVKKEFLGYKIVLTFFSPSGYEVKKNDSIVDYIFYLPLDGPLNAKKFIEIVKPSMAIFVKHDFWHFYIKELKAGKIPLFYISANFRPGQLFFKWYGNFYKMMLKRVTHFFVQNQKSLELLYSQSIPQVTVSGDTRFDRVYQNRLNAKCFPEIEKFCNGKKILIAGSTWPPDEKLIVDLINQSSDDLKFIIVPHEIKKNQIDTIINQISKRSITYSEWIRAPIADAQVIIIDNVGMLASLYQYANFAYIGGAFGKGLHNILEAVVFGLPVFFGPNYRKSPEAIELIKLKTTCSVSSGTALKNRIEELLNNEDTIKKIKSVNEGYIAKNKGATDVIINYLKMNFV